MGHTTELTTTDHLRFPAYVAEPAGAPRGAVVVLQEIFGVNAHIRDVADRFAATGWLAVAPATFHRVEPGVDLAYDAAGMTAGMALKARAESLPWPGVLKEVQAAIDHAAPAGKVGIVGFCWGGLVAWRAAATLRGLHAAVCYYGGGMTAGDEPARQAQVPVLAHFGNRDSYISPESVDEFAHAQPRVDVHRYDADHGFHCDQRGSFDAAAAALAWQRTQAFFTRTLGWK